MRFSRMSCGFLSLSTLFIATSLGAQAGGGRGGLGRGNANAAEFQAKRLPFEPGFRAYIVSNMAGMGAAVDMKEVMSGTEAGAPATSATASFADYEGYFRSLLTQEVNAAVRGARLGGAASFVVSDAHPGNAFGNILPWALDSGATLVRGFPRPIFMISGLDSTFGTLMFDGAVASAGSQGIMPHTFGFDQFTVNGKKLNEVAISALIAGEMGVSLSMVAGDDAVVEETRTMIPNGFVGVVTKYAVGRLAGITYSPARVRQMVAAGAAEAVRREKSGAFKPFTMAKPYKVEFTVQAAITDATVDQIAALPGFNLEKTGARSFRFTTSDAKQIGYLIDAMQPAVVR
jgi:D-amino peptidase